MHLLSAAAWQKADSLAARARLFRSPVICCTSQEGVEKLDLGKKCDDVVPQRRGGCRCDIGSVRSKAACRHWCTIARSHHARPLSPGMALLLSYGLVTPLEIQRWCKCFGPDQEVHDGSVAF